MKTAPPEPGGVRRGGRFGSSWLRAEGCYFVLRLAIVL